MSLRNVVIAILALSSLAAGQVAFQASSLPVQVRQEGITETLGNVVIQATNTGTIKSGSSIAFVYSASITNAGGTSAVSCGVSCPGITASTSGSTFTLTFTADLTLQPGQYILVGQLRGNVNALGTSATTVTTTLSGTSAAPVTNPITFTNATVPVAAIVTPSLSVTGTSAGAFSTCAISPASFSLTVSERFPSALTTFIDESNFTPNVGTVANGTVVLVTVAGLAPGLSVAFVNTSAANSLTLANPSQGTTPVVSTGGPIVFAFAVTGGNTSVSGSIQTNFQISAPGSSISPIFGSAAASASVSLGPVQSTATTLAFANNVQGQRTVATVSDCNPTPTVSTISPTGVGVGSGIFDLVVSGSGFTPASTVNWNGSSLTTTFINSTQLSANVPASFLTTITTKQVTVFNPSPGGGTSNAATFTIGNPSGSIQSLSTSASIIGSPAITLTVTGAGFLNAASVQWNGSARTTTFNSSTSLSATITAQDLATAGVFPVTVLNPSAPSGPSNALNFTVEYDQPVLTALSSTSALAGANGFVLTLTGSKFANGATVYWNSNPLTTTFVSSTSLAAMIPASYLTTAGVFPVLVGNPSPSVGNSNFINFSVSNVVPVLTSLSTTSAVAGSAQFVVNITGSGFVSGAIAQVGGSARTTIFGGATSVGVVLTTADLASATTLGITVTNPSSTGPSNALSFVVTGNNPFPAILNVSPATVAAGSSAFTLTVYGSNFVPTSTVRWNNSDRLTTFGSSQQLSASITAADVLSAGSVTVTVFNPQPGGGGSFGITFTVGTSPQGVVTAGTANGGATLSVAVPVVLTLSNGANLGALSIGFRVTPSAGAPVTTANLDFANDAALPAGAPQIASTSASDIALFWNSFSTPLSGTVTLGVLRVTLPSGAAVGQTYTIHMTGASGAQSGVAIPLTAGADGTISVVETYLVGDVLPTTTDTIGHFGDGQTNTVDLLEVLRMVTNVLQDPPAACSDRWDAMDIFPLDTATTRGGDGVINTLDLLAELRRVTNIDATRPARVPRGCTSVAAESRRTPERASEGRIEIEGNAMYLRASRDMHLAGLALSLRLPDGQDARYAPGAAIASLVDRGQPGVIALAWLDGVTLSVGDRVLLGYIDGADRGKIVAITADEASGRSVHIVSVR